MRFVVKKYDDGNMFAVETTDDGSSIVKSLKGAREVGQRLSAFVEVLGDDTEDGVNRIKEALEYLEEVVAERAALLAQKKKPGPAKKR
jgi:predicted ABC-type ATPase